MQVLDQAWSNFRDSINSDKTLQVYEYCLEQFLLNCNLDLESLLKLEPHRLTNIIIKYISELRLSFQYKNQILCSIKHACEMNDVLLNWVKIKKFNKREKTDNSINGKDRPYTHKEIQQILEYADERAKCAFILLASTGIGIGALHSMKIGDLEKIDNLYKVTVYAGDKEEYLTFCTPECAKQIDSYLQYRERRGETINQDSYLIVRKFSNFTIQKGKPFKGMSLWQTLEKCIPRDRNHHRHKRKEIAIFHGLRKFFTKQLVDSKLNPEIRDSLETVQNPFENSESVFLSTDSSATTRRKRERRDGHRKGVHKYISKRIDFEKQEDPEIQAEIDSGATVKILNDSNI